MVRLRCTQGTRALCAMGSMANRVIPGPGSRDPETRSLSSGKTVAQFSIATNEYIGQGKEKAEYQSTGKV